MQLHSQLILTNLSSLQLDPRALLAFQCTSVSTYLVDCDQLTPFKIDSLFRYFEAPVAYEKNGSYFVIANWLYLQAQFENLIKLNHDFPIILLSSRPLNIEAIAWQYALHSFARSNSRKTVVASLYQAMQVCPSRHLGDFSKTTSNKIKKSTVEALCRGETRQSIATQLSKKG
ncbi:MAG: hypothetical protein ABNH21_00300 [Glaciecola sp.]